MNNRISDLLQNVDYQTRRDLKVGVLACAVGAGVGYFLGQRRRFEVYEFGDTVTVEFDEVVPDEIVEAVEELETTRTDLEVTIEEVTVEETVLVDGVPLDQVPESDAEVKNIFAGGDDEWDFEVETAARTPDEPYVLHRDEFHLDERGFSQMSLTYYAGDDILTDEDNSPLYGFSEIIGELKFGHGSGDPNVFYVRNEKRKAEYEVLRHQGDFSVEVLGLEIENNARKTDLKHSDAPQRFRLKD